MQVYPIIANQQTFNGYIDPKLKKTIKKNLLQSCKHLENCESDLKKDRYQALLEQGKRMFKNLEEFVTPMHKDTSIGIDKNGKLFLSNPVFTNESYTAEKAGISFERIFQIKTAWLSDNKDKIYADGSPYISRTRDLEYAERTMDAINACIKPEEIDEAFLELAERDLEGYRYDNLTGIGFIDKFFIDRVAKKIEKYAEGIGKTTDAKTIAKNRLEELMEIKLKTANERKIKRSVEKPKKKEKTPEDKQLTKQYIREIHKLGENKSV